MSVAHQLLFWKILLGHSKETGKKKKENRPFHKIPSPNGHCPIILPSNWYYVNKILYIFLQFIKSVVKVLGNRCIKITCFRPYCIFNVSIPEYVKALYSAVIPNAGQCLVIRKRSTIGYRWPTEPISESATRKWFVWVFEDPRPQTSAASETRE